MATPPAPAADMALPVYLTVNGVLTRGCGVSGCHGAIGNTSTLRLGGTASENYVTLTTGSGKAGKFIELNPGSCRELEVVWGCYQVANKVQEDASAAPICTPTTGSAAAGAAPAPAPAPDAAAPAPAPAPNP